MIERAFLSVVPVFEGLWHDGGVMKVMFVLRVRLSPNFPQRSCSSSPPLSSMTLPAFVVAVVVEAGA